MDPGIKVNCTIRSVSSLFDTPFKSRSSPHLPESGKHHNDNMGRDTNLVGAQF